MIIVHNPSIHSFSSRSSCESFSYARWTTDEENQDICGKEHFISCLQRSICFRCPTRPFEWRQLASARARFHRWWRWTSSGSNNWKISRWTGLADQHWTASLELHDDNSKKTNRSVASIAEIVTSIRKSDKLGLVFTSPAVISPRKIDIWFIFNLSYGIFHQEKYKRIAWRSQNKQKVWMYTLSPFNCE